MTPSCATMPRNGHDRGGRMKVVGVGRDRPEQRRTEQDAGDDFADHRRLADGGEQPAEQSADDDDGGQRDQEMKRDTSVPDTRAR